MIELKKITAGYFCKHVVQDISLEFRPGEVLAIIGPNGCGKSTLLKAALGLIPTMGGQVLYDGVDLKTMKPKAVAKQAALLSQSRNTPSIQALKMVLHGRFPYLGYPRQYGKKDYEIAKNAMDSTGTAEFVNKNVMTLSGGQRQGVYLAMALAQDTGAVFMDEPTTSLDMNRQLQTLATARNLASQGKAVVLVLHDLSLALGGAERVAVLGEGSLKICGTPAEVFDSGVLDEVFGLRVHRMDTPHGPRYYSTAKEDA